jgi:hypothetical protein
MEVDCEEFIVQLTLWYMAAADLLRDDPILRAQFSGEVELASYAQWQAQRILSSVNSREGK